MPRHGRALLLLGQRFPIVGGPVFGILAGMIVTLLWHDKSAAQPGISFVSKKVLQYAVILLGFGMNLSVIWLCHFTHTNWLSPSG